MNLVEVILSILFLAECGLLLAGVFGAFKRDLNLITRIIITAAIVSGPLWVILTMNTGNIRVDLLVILPLWILAGAIGFGRLLTHTLRNEAENWSWATGSLLGITAMAVIFWRLYT